jgi:hypothetical protein
MSKNRLSESPELTTEGVLPVQSFVAVAVELPPGTPARPRSGRPPAAEVERAAPNETGAEKPNDPGGPSDA